MTFLWDRGYLQQTGVSNLARRSIDDPVFFDLDTTYDNSGILPSSLPFFMSTIAK